MDNGKVDREKIYISSKVNTSYHVTKYNPASPIGFGNCPHEDTCDIIMDYLVKDDIQCLTDFKQISETRYTKIVHKRHKTGLSKQIEYHYCGNNSSYITCAMFEQLIFYFMGMHNSPHHFLDGI